MYKQNQRCPRSSSFLYCLNICPFKHIICFILYSMLFFRFLFSLGFKWILLLLLLLSGVHSYLSFVLFILLLSLRSIIISIIIIIIYTHNSHIYDIDQLC